MSEVAKIDVVEIGKDTKGIVVDEETWEKIFDTGRLLISKENSHETLIYFLKD